MASIQVTFVKNATTITLPAPISSRIRASRKYQTIGQTETGATYTYSSSVSNYEVELAFESLADSEKDDLQSFFEDTVGITGTFTYTDPTEDAHTAQFIEPSLIFTKISDGIWDVMFPLELASFEG